MDIETIQKIAGITAGALSILLIIPYIISILKGKARPARSTWIIWSLVTLLLLTSYYEVGGAWANLISLGDFLVAATVAILSIKYGVGGWSRLDKFCFAGCGVALILWAVTGSALVALLATIFIDALGATATIVKTFKDPEQEDKLTWKMAFLGNSINLIAVPLWSFSHSVYPIFMVVMSGTVMALTLRKKAHTGAAAE